MLSFNQYTNFIFEELNPIQKKGVDSWVKKHGSTAQDISSHLPFNDQGRLEIPLEHTEENSAISPEIEQHLNKKGYKPISKNLAVDSTGKRQMKIGKLLADNPELQKQHALSGAKSGSDNKNVKIIISRHPHDVAGMSTDRGWTSCMNMEDKCDLNLSKNKYLPQEIKHGTHVAYLVNNDDNDIKKPIARIALKPFHGVDTGHTILQPEEKVYGTAPSDFLNTIKKWTKNNFPKQDLMYQKNKQVYNDQDGGEQKKEKPYIYKDNISHDDLTNLLKNPNYAYGAVHHPDITPEHLDLAMLSPDNKVKEAALSHPKIKSKHMNNAMNDIVNDNFRKAVLRNPNVSTENVKKGLTDFLSDVRIEALKHKSVTNNDLEHIANNDKHPHVRNLAQKILNKRNK